MLGLPRFYTQALIHSTFVYTFADVISIHVCCHTLIDLLILRYLHCRCCVRSRDSRTFTRVRSVYLPPLRCSVTCYVLHVGSRADFPDFSFYVATRFCDYTCGSRSPLPRFTLVPVYVTFHLPTTSRSAHTAATTTPSFTPAPRYHHHHRCCHHYLRHCHTTTHLYLHGLRLRFTPFHAPLSPATRTGTLTAPLPHLRYFTCHWFYHLISLRADYAFCAFPRFFGSR